MSHFDSSWCLFDSILILFNYIVEKSWKSCKENPGNFKYTILKYIWWFNMKDSKKDPKLQMHLKNGICSLKSSLIWFCELQFKFTGWKITKSECFVVKSIFANNLSSNSKLFKNVISMWTVKMAPLEFAPSVRTAHFESIWIGNNCHQFWHSNKLIQKQ